jgi:hemerythrin
MQSNRVETMRRAHEVLRDDLQRLHADVQSPATANLMDVCGRLGAVRDHVANHFRLEEEGGYMDAIGKRQPRLDHAIRKLAEEHASLLQSLDQIIQEASRATAIDDRLCRRITAWVASVLQHEDRENRFIQDAYDLDIGAND